MSMCLHEYNRKCLDTFYSYETYAITDNVERSILNAGVTDGSFVEKPPTSQISRAFFDFCFFL